MQLGGIFFSLAICKLEKRFSSASRLNYLQLTRLVSSVLFVRRDFFFSSKFIPTRCGGVWCLSFTPAIYTINSFAEKLKNTLGRSGSATKENCDSNNMARTVSTEKKRGRLRYLRFLKYVCVCVCMSDLGSQVTRRRRCVRSLFLASRGKWKVRKAPAHIYPSSDSDRLLLWGVSVEDVFFFLRGVEEREWRE